MLFYYWIVTNLVQFKNKFDIESEYFNRIWLNVLFDNGSPKIVFRLMIGFFELLSETLRRNTCGSCDKMMELLYDKGMKSNKTLSSEMIWKRALECKVTRAMLEIIDKESPSVG